MFHAEDIERAMNALEEMAEASTLPAEEALAVRARAEGICPDCLIAASIANSDTPDEAVSFSVGVIVGAALANSKVEE
jgi:hypothetical protein